MANQEAAMAVIDLPGGSSIKLEALDPTTSAPVAGVKVNNTAISAIDLSDQDEPEEPPKLDAYMPVFTYGVET